MNSSARTSFAPSRAFVRAKQAEPRAAGTEWRGARFHGERVVLWLAVGLAGLAHFNLIWNHFFRDVPYLFDAGWYGALVHRNGPVLENPSAVVFWEIGPWFYATHFSPGLWLMSLPSWLLPVSMPVWLAVLEGLKHGALAFVVWGLVRELRSSGIRAATKREAGWEAATGGVVVWLAAFNGVLLACNVFPHFETWMAPLALGFFWALHRGRTGAAGVCLAALISLREDMGFHLCGLLLVMAVVRGWRPWRRPWRRPGSREARRWLVFAGAGFAASVAALVLMRTAFPGDRAFARVYLGDPVFAHLDAEMLVARLRLFWEERAYLWAPPLVCAAWAAAIRSWWPLIGYAAFVPWTVLHVCAASVYAGALASYYGFPYALALLWPLAGALFFARRERPGAILGWVAALVLVSIAAFPFGNDLGAAVNRMRAPVLGTREPIEMAVAGLADAVARGERVVVDDGVAAQAPRAFTKRNLFHQSEGSPEIVAFYDNGRQQRDGRAHAERLPHRHRVPGTSITVVSAKELPWAGLVTEPAGAREGER